MEFKDALKRVEKTQEVKKAKKDNYFLNSGIAILPAGESVKSWIFTYYNEKENKVIQAVVDANSIEFKEPATPIQPTKKELKPIEVKTNSDKILEKATIEFKKLREPLSEIIMSIQDNGELYWHVNFITKTLCIVSVFIDAKKGTIMRVERTNLSR